MGKILFVIIALIAVGTIWAFPLYLCANFVLWVFHMQYHLTLLQAFALCLLATVLHVLFFSDKEDK